MHEVHVADRGEDGTLLVSALAEATAELPADRIAGAILVTDGAGARRRRRSTASPGRCRCC